MTLAEPRPRRDQIRIVLFAGGSGAHSITEAMLGHPQIALTILINAYDDGHSTGRLRRFIPSMLGPSDVRKNLNRLMPTAERGQRALRALSEHRLPVGVGTRDALALVGALGSGATNALPPALADAADLVSVRKSRTLRSYLTTFLAYHEQAVAEGRAFDFTDCALGNLFFAGCYLETGRDFNAAIRSFATFHDVAPDVLQNVTMGENLFLVAEKEDGTFLTNEADIVAQQTTARISQLYLVDPVVFRERIEGRPVPPEGWGPLVRSGARTPVISASARAALGAADVIIYGPGTQHSSLFPSYLTEGVAEAIAANCDADKVFIGNVRRDHDIAKDDINDLVEKFYQLMGRGAAWRRARSDLVTQFFLQRADETGAAMGQYIPFDPARFDLPMDTVRLKDWEAQEGRHAGGYVVDELRRLVQARIDVALEPLVHLVSIVIPVLDEAPTIARVLAAVTALDFQPYGMSKEVILVDGGSRDGTVALARSVRNVKVLELPRGRGRGAALRHGIEHARGNVIAFFPGDLEYRAEDLYRVVEPVVRSKYKAAFGTRAVKCTDLAERLKRIYHHQRRLYLTSQYGGMLLSIATLLLYNRYMTDVLTSVKAFDAAMLRSLALESDGLDLETEIVAKLSLAHEYLLEVPVEYAPRTKAEGKKITAKDGLAALLALVKFRLRRRPRA